MQERNLCSQGKFRGELKRRIFERTKNEIWRISLLLLLHSNVHNKNKRGPKVFLEEYRTSKISGLTYMSSCDKFEFHYLRSKSLITAPKNPIAFYFDLLYQRPFEV